MKNLSFILVFFFVLSCKESTKEPDLPEEKNVRVNREDLDIQRRREFFDLKRLEIVGKEDHKTSAENFVVSKSLKNEKIDFEYPFLNENLNPDFKKFNQYISDKFLDLESEVHQFSMEERPCDIERNPDEIENRIINYKFYRPEKDLISVLFYIENHSVRAAHPSYSFQTVNFRTKNGTVLKYEDFFKENSEEDFRMILNEILSEKINEGEMFYDCHEISSEDFISYKSNFIVREDFIEFFFDDCIICPSYTDTFSVEIPFSKLEGFLKN